MGSIAAVVYWAIGIAKRGRSSSNEYNGVWKGLIAKEKAVYLHAQGKEASAKYAPSGRLRQHLLNKYMHCHFHDLMFLVTSISVNTIPICTTSAP